MPFVYPILGAALSVAALAQTQEMQTPATVETARLEKKIIDDLTTMIHGYDFSSVFNEAITEEQARQIAWEAEYQPTVQELLKKLQEQLKEEAQLEQMWPDARMKDREMFSHLNLSFDLTDDKITVETAAKDYHGVPIYQYIYDTDDHTQIEITNLDESGIVTEVLEGNPSGEIVVPTEEKPVSAVETAPVIEIPPVAVPDVVSEPEAVLENPGEAEVGRILTPEEQREVAIKVVGFFIMLIIASFVLLYIYHRCSQSKTRSQRNKKTFFEFLAGEMDDQYPIQNPLGQRMAPGQPRQAELLIPTEC